MGKLFCAKIVLKRNCGSERNQIKDSPRKINSVFPLGNLLKYMKFNPRRKKDHDFLDWNSISTAIFRGHCPRCKNAIFATKKDGDVFDPDPRGVFGAKHSCSSLEAHEYNMTGADVCFCYSCLDSRPSYEQCLAIAKKIWT